MIDDEEVKNLDVDHTISTCEVLDSSDDKAHSYHESLMMKTVNIRTDVETKEAIY